jgi:aspartate aminotransferase-like enzyme
MAFWIVVDAVSSMGGAPLPVDKWDIDLCVTVANKVLETPPALSLLSIAPVPGTDRGA